MTVSDRILSIKKTIEEARLKSPNKDDVVIVGVTKNHPVEAANDIISNGISIIAENRVQAMKEKIDSSLLLPSKRHLIGHLQTNKVKLSLDIFDLIQSVDSERLLLTISKEAAKKSIVAEIFFQVNIAREEIKFGMFKEDLPEMLSLASELENIRVSGLMSIMPVETREKYYRDMYELFMNEKTKSYKNVNLKFLSMGMSGDYIQAVSCGANMVRLGRCLFN